LVFIEEKKEMITREQALTLIRGHVKNEKIVWHMIALEALMGGIYQELKKSGKSEQSLGGSEEEYRMAGLLHDGDYTDEVPAEKQGIEVTNWARAKGYEIPESVAHAMAAHNWHNTGVEPKSLMDWTIFCGDSLTGLIVACTLVRPEKKIALLELPSVMKKFKQPSFASGTRRDEIALCEEKLGIKLEDFVRISLASMQGVADQIGL
jgi:predicted hydrolase (HD superfamily)